MGLLSWTPDEVGLQTITIEATDARGVRTTQVVEVNVVLATPYDITFDDPSVEGTALLYGNGDIIITITAPPSRAGTYNTTQAALEAGPVNLAPPVVTIVPALRVPLVEFDTAAIDQPPLVIPGALVPVGYVPAASGGTGDLSWTTSKSGDNWLLTFDDWIAARAALWAGSVTQIEVPLVTQASAIALIGGEATFTAEADANGDIVITITAPPEYAGEYTVTAADLANGPVQLVAPTYEFVEAAP